MLYREIEVCACMRLFGIRLFVLFFASSIKYVANNIPFCWCSLSVRDHIEGVLAGICVHVHCFVSMPDRITAKHTHS